MRRIHYFCTICLLNACTISAQPSVIPEEVDHLALYCKVWGFLKYYHPAVADHRINWDSTFIKYYDKVKSVSSKEEFNTVLYSLYKDAENCKDSAKHHVSPLPSNFGLKIYPVINNRWISDDHFTREISEILHTIESDFKAEDNYYLASTGGSPFPSFRNDSLWYNSSLFPPESIRILALSRYWNIIEYFCPNKEGLQWNSILKTYILRVMNAHDTAYHLVMMELCQEIVDGHSATMSPILLSYFGTGKLPIECSYVEGKTIIANIYPPLPSAKAADSALSVLGLSRGEILLKINGINIDTIRDRIRKFTPHSNEAALQNVVNVSLTVVDTTRDYVLTVSDGAKIKDVTIKYLSLYDPIIYKRRKTYGKPWKILESNIGYIDFPKLTDNDVDSAMADLSTTQSIIIDIRGYPSNTERHLASFLADSAKWNVYTFPLSVKPGYFLKSATEFRESRGVKKKKYNGHIVVLVNENTMSHAEYCAMLFQAIDGTKTFGSQTAGADGNVTYIYLPGNIMTRMSGIGIYYPDGTPTQRVGLKIDFPVTPTIKGVREGRDEVLDAAINYVQH
jgi:C-terminal processing protease CtpA/Prc